MSIISSINRNTSFLGSKDGNQVFMVYDQGEKPLMKFLYGKDNCQGFLLNLTICSAGVYDLNAREMAFLPSGKTWEIMAPMS